MDNKILFAGKNLPFFESVQLDGFSASDYRIPSLVVSGKNTVAIIDSAATGADWGNIAIGVKVSQDCGESWSDEIRVFSPPCAKASTDFHATTSAFAMDAVTVVKRKKIIMLFDFFPESKGLHNLSRLEKTDGYCEIDGKKYLMLFSKNQSVKSLKRVKTATGFYCYTLREDGFVYDPNGVKTKYYLPKNHSSRYHYETLGDLYYGEGKYLEKEPPLYPDNFGDKYAGNIFLNSSMPELEEEPSGLKKRAVEEPFCTAEAPAAPLRAAITSYIYQTESLDGGTSWSQPVDITPQVKNKKDKKFFGTGPGVGIILKNQKDSEKNGRILFPVYALGKSAVIYSDDGKKWERGDSLYSKNLDETQLLEDEKGNILCFGRQKKYGKTPLSISVDGGESFRKLSSCEVYSVKCQKSFLMLPKNGENGFAYPASFDSSSRYFVCAHPTGHYGSDSSRNDGVLSIYRLERKEIAKVGEISIKDAKNYDYMGKYASFFAYSSLALLPDNSIGILYEAYPSGCIVFAKTNL